MWHLSTQEQKAVDEFKRRVISALGPQVLSFTLFGSRARGEGHEESDLDILVLLRQQNRQAHDMVIDLASDLYLESCAKRTRRGRLPFKLCLY